MVNEVKAARLMSKITIADQEALLLRLEDLIKSHELMEAAAPTEFKAWEKASEAYFEVESQDPKHPEEEERAIRLMIAERELDAAAPNEYEIYMRSLKMLDPLDGESNG